MTAARYHDYGGADEVLRVEQVSLPAIAPDEILVRVRAGAVNPADWKFRAGWFAQWVPLPLPFIPGSDFSGEVAAAGPLASRFSPGDAVFGMRMPQQGGALAHYLAVNQAAVAPAPGSLPIDEAAAYPLAALTAWAALLDAARIGPGMRLLVTAAAGGVGLMAVQLAKIAGASVIASCGAAKWSLVRALGADQTIDIRLTDFAEGRGACDLVLDAYGGEGQARAAPMLRPGGMLVTLDPTPPSPALCERLGISGAAVALAPDGARLAQVAALIDQKRLRMPIERAFTLADVAAAQVLSQSGTAAGKILIRMS